jgi:hypothetical protein
MYDSTKRLETKTIRTLRKKKKKKILKVNENSNNARERRLFTMKRARFSKQPLRRKINFSA